MRLAAHLVAADACLPTPRRRQVSPRHPAPPWTIISADSRRRLRSSWSLGPCACRRPCPMWPRGPEDRPLLLRAHEARPEGSWISACAMRVTSSRS